MESLKNCLLESMVNEVGMIEYDSLNPISNGDYHPIYITKIVGDGKSIISGQPPKKYFDISKISDIVGKKLPGGLAYKFSLYVSQYLDTIDMKKWIDLFKKTILPGYTIQYWHNDCDGFEKDHDYEKSSWIDHDGCEIMKYAIYKGSKLEAYLKIGGH